jgi:hypothetical protein
MLPPRGQDFASSLRYPHRPSPTNLTSAGVCSPPRTQSLRGQPEAQPAPGQAAGSPRTRHSALPWNAIPECRPAHGSPTPLGAGPLITPGRGGMHCVPWLRDTALGSPSPLTPPTSPPPVVSKGQIVSGCGAARGRLHISAAPE